MPAKTTKKKTATKGTARRAKRVSTKRTGAKSSAKRSSARQSSRRTLPAARDAVSLLRADHVTIRQLLAELKAADTLTRREKALEQTEARLKAHTTIEEEIFYPAFRDAARTKKDRELFFEAKEEHRAADMVLGEVGRAADEEFSARAKVLKELVEHHAEEEESDMFPRARALLSAPELKRLGEEMAARQRELLAKSPSTLERVASLLPFTK